MRRTTLLVPATVAAALVLSGCVPNNVDAAALTVDISDDSCQVSASSAAAGAIRFTATNNGTDVNEFEILADDLLRVVGEKENIAPGQTVDYVVNLEPGTYYTECKLGMAGEGIGTSKFTVTGAKAAVDAGRQEQIDKAVTDYVSYIEDQTRELVADVTVFADAYAAGDDEKARSLYASTRVHYERIEPTAEAFGELDPKIDFREPMASEDGIPFTGFHRIEKDLWAPAGFTPSTQTEREELAAGLVDNVRELDTLVHAEDFSVGIADISNGAIGLLDEVATSKITGEEDAFSHTDLSDFAANVEGASVAYGVVRTLAESSGDAGRTLVKGIDARFDDLTALLGRYGSIEEGFVSYSELSTAQVKDLSDAINALSEPLSQLTHAVLGIAE